jgi:hypothetical protein
MNWVLLSVIMLLGMSNRYMISLMNSTALAAIIDDVGFALTHLVNLYTATKICVNPPLSFLNGPTRSYPHGFCESTFGFYGRGPVKPMLICHAHKCACNYVAAANP